jgi:hypothetical protein
MFQVVDDEGRLLDAHLELTETAVIVHSRGGTKGAANERNSQYGDGLRTLLRRLQTARLNIDGAWVDSSVVQALPLSERMILQPGEDQLGPTEAFRLVSTRMAKVGRSDGASGGNPTKRILISFSPSTPISELQHRLGLEPVNKDFRSADRIPTEEWAKVGADHIFNAVQKLSNGFTDHPFGPSIDYDLVVNDGRRLPPKAVFGLAASEALGFEVLPKHFTGGVGTPCFKALERAGYVIVKKGAEEDTSPPDIHEDEREWVEGKPRIINHLRRERARGLAAAKKDSFVRQHGRLYCEECGLDPVEAFGEFGPACIEVHHRAIAVSDMSGGHVSRFGDLQCLCANCHRVEHRRLAKEGQEVI